MSRKVSIAISALGRTWQWLAPEVIDSQSEHFDERSDIYRFLRELRGKVVNCLSNFFFFFFFFSFGIVVWECLTQQQPFAEFDEFMLPSLGLVNNSILLNVLFNKTMQEFYILISSSFIF